MITKTKLVKRIFSSLLTAALAVPMTALTAHATGEAFFYPPKNPVMTDQQFEVSVTFFCRFRDRKRSGKYRL